VPYVGTGIFAPNGRVFILSCGTKITLWDVVSGYQIKELFNGDVGDRNFLVYGLFLNPAKNLLFANFYDKNGQSQKEFTFLRWDTDSWHPINTLVGDFSGLSFSPDGNTFTPVRKETNILDSNDFTKLLNFTDARRLGLYSGISMAYDPSGKYFAIVDVVSTDNAGIYYVYLYNASTGKFIRRTSSFIVETLEFSPDGTKLAIGGGSERQGAVTIWDLSQP
jgi:WD40 repeat protein